MALPKAAFQYVSNYCTAVWDVPIFRNMTIVMVFAYIICLLFDYLAEKYEDMTLSPMQYFTAWAAQKSYLLTFATHGILFANTSGLFKSENEEQFWGIAFLFISATFAFFLLRLGHNLICWYLGTPLWPWNPFVNKPGFEKIVAKNQRYNKRRWLAEQRRKRVEGKRYSDE